MKTARLPLRLGFVVMSAAGLAQSGLACATAQRTFVASNGNDAGSCSISQPCRSFAAAIAKTNAGGEVIVQDSAGYGPVTITQSVSIIAPTGIYAGISVFSGTGVTINGSGIAVALRGLTINGQGGFTGVNFIQGARLMIEDCEIASLNRGIDTAASNSTVSVRNTVLRNNVIGFSASGSVEAVLDRVHANANDHTGVLAESGARVTITTSVLAHNTDLGVLVSALDGLVADMMITQSTVVGSTYGLAVVASPGSTGRLVSDGTAINDSANAAFDFVGGGGTEIIYTSGNNSVGFNNGIVSGGALTPIGTH